MRGEPSRAVCKGGVPVLKAKSVKEGVTREVGTFRARIAKVGEATIPRRLRRVGRFSRMCSLATLSRRLRGTSVIVNYLPKAPRAGNLLGCRQLCSVGGSTVLIGMKEKDLVPARSLVEMLRRNRLGKTILSMFRARPLPRASPL